MEGLKEKLTRWIALSLVVAIVIGGAIFLWPTYSRLGLLRRQEMKLDRQIAEKQREIAALKENQRRFHTDPDFVEYIARQNHRVFPGELVFLFEKKK